MSDADKTAQSLDELRKQLDEQKRLDEQLRARLDELQKQLDEEKQLDQGDGARPGRQISNLSSFDEHTSGPGQQAGREVAGLYAYMHLDVLVKLAHKVSLDFFARPDVYRDPRVEDVAPTLAAMHARYGCHEDYLSCQQRRVIFASLFGEAETEAGTGPPQPVGGAPDGAPFATGGVASSAVASADRFGPERDQLLAATAAFAERVYDTGEQPLRDTVGVFAPGLRSYLSDLNHAMVHWARTDGLRKLTEETSYKILRNPGIAAAYGTHPAGAGWPYHEQEDGTTLVARLAHEFFGGDVSKYRQDLIDRQRLALRGAEAIATVLDFVDGGNLASDDTKRMISKSYTWHAARGRALGIPLTTIAVAQGHGLMLPASVDGDRRNRSLFGAGTSTVPDVTSEPADQPSYVR